jgi:hypothetical protein
MEFAFVAIILSCLGIGLIAAIIGFFLFNGSHWWN